MDLKGVTVTGVPFADIVEQASQFVKRFALFFKCCVAFVVWGSCQRLSTKAQIFAISRSASLHQSMLRMRLTRDSRYF